MQSKNFFKNEGSFPYNKNLSVNSSFFLDIFVQKGSTLKVKKVLYWH